MTWLQTYRIASVSKKKRRFNQSYHYGNGNWSPQYTKRQQNESWISSTKKIQPKSSAT